jgi:hypothetical protein
LKIYKTASSRVPFDHPSGQLETHGSGSDVILTPGHLAIFLNLVVRDVHWALEAVYGEY